MFDAKRFIKEVQSRLCLWNLKDKSYGDREAKRRAWEEIAEILFVEWETYDTKKKNETLVDLQKKWKHLRDYFVRERKKDSNIRSGSAAAKQRNRKRPYIEMLRFLDVVKEIRPTTSNIKDIDETGGKETARESSNSNSATREVHSMTQFHRPLVNNMETSKDDSDSDKQFLLSLLPQMKKMSEAQNFDFRLDIMNLVKKYRFGTTSAVQYDILPDQSNYEQRQLSLPQTSQFDHSSYYKTEYKTNSPQSTNSQGSTEDDTEEKAFIIGS